ncbi:reverse transcriptase domain-containing protein [Tanacetum coccineum]
MSRTKKSGRLAKWVIELGEHDISYQHRTSIQGQVLADFLAKVPTGEVNQVEQATTIANQETIEVWKFFTDGSLNKGGSRARLVLTILDDVEFTYALRFEFKASNNKANYEALLAGLRIAEFIGVKHIEHALRSLISCDKSNVVGMLLADNAHRCPNADQSMSGVSNICGPFSEAARKVKFLIVAIDYFIKWIEAKTVAAIMGKQVMKFVWDNIVCRFGLSREIILDNEKQFRDNLFRTWCEKLNITQDFASVKHSESNTVSKTGKQNFGELAAIAEEKHKRKMEKYYNLTVWSIVLKPRDLVYHSNEAIKKEDTRKLGPKWEGPYEVIETLGDKAYRLRD